MADTRDQMKAEKWVVEEFLPSELGQTFSGRKLELTWGGEFNFDAVSEDGTIVALISTSTAKTASGKSAVGKIHKLKSDTLYLLNVQGARQRILIFTERSMLERFEREQASRRFPPEVEVKLIYAPLPREHQERVDAARKQASEETSPKR